MRSALIAMLLLVGTTSAQASAQARARPALVRSASIPFGNCPAKDVVMRVTIARFTYRASQPVNVVAVVRNASTHPCTYGGNVDRIQIIGPCGALSLQVFDGAGVDIWPGPVAYSCPAIGAVALAAKGEVRASGSWPKLVVTRSATSAAPLGTYRLVIDRRVSFTITLR
jgi:hypothetical protein